MPLEALQFPALVVAVPTAVLATVKALQLGKSLLAGSATNGHAAETRGWQKAVMEQQVKLLEGLAEGQETQRGMLRDLTVLTQSMARELEQHGEREAKMWERVVGELEAISDRRHVPRTGG